MNLFPGEPSLQLLPFSLLCSNRYEAGDLIREAFAAQALACQRELGIDNAKLNVNGGAIAIGHPLGCSGARLATTLIHQMARTGASRGIASLCVGVGQGLATVFERK